MGFVRGRWREYRWWRGRSTASTARLSSLVCISFCFFSVCALQLRGAASATAIVSETFHSRSRGTGGSPVQGPPETTRGDAAVVWEQPRRRSTIAAVRRYLAGPGSYPPRCASKCGDCSPCKPVHVPVPPGTPGITEYYPEAWRCKCGGKLYMP